MSLYLLDSLIKSALEEDIGPGGITTEAIFEGSGILGRGELVAKQDLILAGADAAERVFTIVDPEIKWECFSKEGEHLKAGTVFAVVSGPVVSMLRAERTALNFLQKLCGIATWTARFVKKLEGTGVILRDTRKTLPGLRVLSKRAARAGGAINHRMGLYDQYLIKDNHIDVEGSISECLRRVHKSNINRIKVEVEVRSEAEAAEAIAGGADALLLDNMEEAEVRKITAKWRDRIELELSGNVTLDNIERWATTGVHAISVGAITHSAPAADISMKVKRL